MLTVSSWNQATSKVLIFCFLATFGEKSKIVVSLWCKVRWPSRPCAFELVGHETWSKLCLPCPLWYFGPRTFSTYFIGFPTKFCQRNKDSMTVQQEALEVLSQESYVIPSGKRDSQSFLCWLRRVMFLFVSFLSWKLNWNDHHTLSNDLMILTGRTLFNVQQNSNYV